MRPLPAWILLAAALAAPLGAADPPVAPQPATATPITALRCAAAIDVVRGARIERAVVLVQGGRITAIGSELPIPAGATVVDLGDTTLLPGLIDAHTHLLSRFEPRLGDENTNAIVGLSTMSAGSRALLGAAMAREMLEAGFTTVRDLGNSGRGGDVALRDAIRQGWVPGPRMVVSSRAIAPPGGQFTGLVGVARQLTAEEYVEIAGPEDARRAVREAIYDGASVIKVIVDTGVQLSDGELLAIVDEAHRAGSKVAAHAGTDEAARAAARAGVDSVEHAYSAPDDVLRLMAERKIYLVPTDFPASAEVLAPEQVEAEKKRLARAIELGVPIVAGSDIYYSRQGMTRGQFAKQMYRAYANAGMTPAQILRATTVDAARLLGWEREVGTLEVGKRADLLAVSGDPLVDVGALDKVRAVFKGGVAIVLDGASAAPRR